MYYLQMKVTKLTTVLHEALSPDFKYCLSHATRNLGLIKFRYTVRAVNNKGADRAVWMPRLICVFAGRTVILLVLS